MIGDWHTLGSYTFRETLHGPMYQAPCEDCGRLVALVLPSWREGEPPRDYPTEAICSGCGRARHGAALPLRPTYPRVTVSRSRMDPKHGGRVPMEGFFFRAIHPNDPRVNCSVCALPIDPAALTVEHPEQHPSCIRYPEDAPMEIFLS